VIFVELRGQYILPFDFIEHYKVSRLNCTNLFVTTNCLNNLSTGYAPMDPMKPNHSI